MIKEKKMNLNYKYRLTFEETLGMIDEVYDTVFDVDVETGLVTYLPELYDYAFRLAIARYYGNYVPTKSADMDFEVAMDVDINSISIDKAQLRGVEDAIKEKIEMRKTEINKSNITVASTFEELKAPLISIINTLDNIVSSFDVELLNKKIKTLDMKHLVNTYLKSDLANKNRTDVLDEKNNKIRQLNEALNQYTAKNVLSDNN